MSLVLLGAPHCSVGFLKQRENASKHELEMFLVLGNGCWANNINFCVVSPNHYQNIGTFSFGTSFFPLIIGILQLRRMFYTLIGTSEIRQN